MNKIILDMAALAAKLLPDWLKSRLYRMGFLSKALRKQLNKAAPHGLSRVRVAAGVLKGNDFILDMQTEKDYWLGTYETELQNSLSQLVKPGMVLYDVGANVGYISLMLGKLTGPRGQVICFEALPDNQERLKKNTELNQHLSHFLVVPKAVAKESGSVEFFVHHSDDMGKVAGSAGREEQYANAIHIPAVSLDDFIFKQQNPKPDLIKIDIEGGEVLALPGMANCLKQCKPIVLIELHGPESAEACFTALKEANYRIYRMTEDQLEVHSPAQLDWKAYLVGVSKQ